MSWRVAPLIIAFAIFILLLMYREEIRFAQEGWR